MTRKELKEKIHALDMEQLNLINSFVENEMDMENFKGKKVRCYHYNEWDDSYSYVGMGYVAGRESSASYLRSCYPYYQINKIKKDGTMSQTSAGFYQIGKVELINE